MLSSRTLAFILATATSSLALAAPPDHVPFVPSTVQRPDSHAGRFGLVTIVSYGSFGQKTTSTQIIDLDTYIRSGAKKMVVGPAAVKEVEAEGICLVPDPIDGGCAVSGSGTGNGGSGYGSGGPTSPAPTPPNPPDPANVPWNVTQITYTQVYDHGQWEQTTTYNRVAYPNGEGGGTDGPWGYPVTSNGPVKH